MSYLTSAKKIIENCTSNPLTANSDTCVLFTCEKKRRYRFKKERYFPKYFIYLVYEMNTKGNTTIDKMRIKLKSTCKNKNCLNPLHLIVIDLGGKKDIINTKQRTRLTHDEVRKIKTILECTNGNLESNDLREYCNERKITNETVIGIANKFIYSNIT
jgi:hypothetical protein